jgi:hypothetical protein
MWANMSARAERIAEQRSQLDAIVARNRWQAEQRRRFR